MIRDNYPAHQVQSTLFMLSPDTGRAMNVASAHRIYANRRWHRVRRYVLERDRYRCQIQGPTCQHTATSADHITPLSQGGAPYDPANLRAACQPCNSGRNVVRTRAQPSRQW